MHSPPTTDSTSQRGDRQPLQPSSHTTTTTRGKTPTTPTASTAQQSQHHHHTGENTHNTDSQPANLAPPQQHFFFFLSPYLLGSSLTSASLYCSTHRLQQRTSLPLCHTDRHRVQRLPLSPPPPPPPPHPFEMLRIITHCTTADRPSCKYNNNKQTVQAFTCAGTNRTAGSAWSGSPTEAVNAERSALSGQCRAVQVCGPSTDWRPAS